MTSEIKFRCIDEKRTKILYKLVGKDISDNYIDRVQKNNDSFSSFIKTERIDYNLYFRSYENLIQVFKHINHRCEYYKIEYNGEIYSEIIRC